MCERLCDADTCGGIEAEHFLEEVKGCVGVVPCLEQGCGRDKDVTLRISMRNEFFE